MDEELLKVVFEDLEYVSEEWNLRDISDVRLRQSSGILRRLLVEGDLFKAARSMGMTELRVLDTTKGPASFSGVEFYQAGGGSFNGMKVRDVTTYRGNLSNKKIAEEVRRTHEEGKQKNRPIKLNKFMKRTSMIIQGIEINREEIIKYVCNRLGGVHYNPERNTDDKEKLEAKYILLDEHRNSTEIARKNAIYFELLSIGQKLVNNKDVKRLVKKIKDQLKRNKIN